MSTRKIKDAKDLRDGSLIYFKGHAKATYMSDGSTVEDVINDIKVNGSGNSDLFDYETKVESQNKLQEAKDYTDTAIANLVDSAPETLNTLNELAVAIQENEDVVDALNQSIGSKQDTITDLETIRQGAAKGATALQSYTEQYKGTVTGVKINGTTKNPSSGVVDLGNVITSHQDISGKQDKLVSGTNIKTINGESLLGNGNITISQIIYIPNESSMPETPVEGVLYLIGEE